MYIIEVKSGSLIFCQYNFTRGRIMAKKTGKNLKYLRENNKAKILKFLLVNKGCSRMELSSYLGLSKMTITNLISELTEGGYLTEKKKNTKETMSTTGPKPMMLNIKRNRILAIGVHMSRNFIRCALTDMVHGEIYTVEESVSKSDVLKSIFEKTAVAIQKVIEYDSRLNGNIIGIGIASSELEYLSVKEEIENKFPYSIFIINQMHASALGEQLYGHGRNRSDFLYLGISNRVGAAEITNGKLLRGNNGYAVEIGHMSLNYQGQLCSCGNRGCLELYLGIPELLRKSESLTISELVEKHKKGDPRALMTLEEFTRILGLALSNIGNIFDPSCIVIGQEGAVLMELVMKKVKNFVNLYYGEKHGQQIEIFSSSFKEKDSLRGAAAFVFQNLFDGSIELTTNQK